MQQFTQCHQEKVAGMLSGFDRVRLRGTLRWLANCRGMHDYLWKTQVKFKEFTQHAKRITDQVRASGRALAEAAGRPALYLNSTATRKEETARRIAATDGIKEGLICLLTCVEPCFSYQVGPNRQSKHLELRGGQYKCLHHYFYLMDERFGFMHLRLQTWFPFNVHICLNGREWLGRQMDAAGIGYERRGNCFTQVADVACAQQLLDEQVGIDWQEAMNSLIARWHPTHARIFARHPIPYYWSADETEWASDVMFHSPADRDRLYPRLVNQAIQSLGSGDVMRFLGRPTPAHGGVNGNFTGDVISDLRRRPEGVRVKHQLNRNAIKMYDKQHNVLRVETTINDARDMKVYRRKEGDGPEKPKQWLRLRKGVADLPRRMQISQAANDRYLDAMATVEDATPLGQLTGKLCQPVRWKGRRVRALNPLGAEDLGLLKAIRRGEFTINGFRNRDLRDHLFKAAARDKDEDRRRASKVTRQLRLLRAHGLIRKVSHTHRYILKPNAAVAIDALLAAQNANTEQLQQLAA